MSGVIFYYEDKDADVWSGHPTQTLDAWNYACKLSDIDSVIIINKTDDVLNFNLEFDVQIVKELPEITGTIAQIVCPWDFEDTISVWDFDHQIDWYILGPSCGWNKKELSDTKITIPCPSRAALHSVHAFSIVSAHRYEVINNGS